MILSQKYTILSCGGVCTHTCIHNRHIQGTTVKSNQRQSNEFTIGIWNDVQVISKHEKFHNIDKKTLGGSQGPF
jgi:hypothetical protein